MADLNANFPDAIIASKSEQSLKKKWQHIYQSNLPVISILYGGGKGPNYNKGIGVSQSISGSKALLPIFAEGVDSSQVRGMSADVYDFGAGSFTDSPVTPVITRGPTQAEYPFTGIEGFFWLTNIEKTLALSGDRGNLLDGKVDQLKFRFRQLVETQLSGNTAASIANVEGLRNTTGTTNTVGGISQSTAASWASNVDTSGGPFTWDMIDRNCNKVRALGRHFIDTILFYQGASLDLFQKAKAATIPAQMVTNVEETMKYGFENFIYSGKRCVMHNTGTSGEIIGLSLDSWYLADNASLGGDNGGPVALQTQLREGTTRMEYPFVMWLMVGTNDPGCQFRATGVS